MSSPLLEVDANAQRTGSKPVKGSKISNQPTAQHPGSSGRRSPFSVSATGSPRYNTVSPPPRTTMSPAIASKIPRKSQTPTHISIPKVNKSGGISSVPPSSLPTRGPRQSLATPTPVYSVLKPLNPLSSRNKPLPSPPIAQVINPNSPPKAQRTLVDAESGSPSEGEWPILRPENVSPSTKSVSDANKPSMQQRSVSQGAAPKHIANSYFANTKLAPANMAGTSSELKVSPSPAEGISSRYHEFMQMTEPRTLNSKNPYATAFHAISTGTESAMESPLAHKRSAPSMIPIPPRISSKRSSLPLPGQLKPDSPTLPPPPQSRQVKPGSTQWPLLATQDTKKPLVTSASLPEPRALVTISVEPQSQNVQDPQRHVSQSSDTYHTAQSLSDSVKSNSSWSMAAGSSLDDDPGYGSVGTTRIKRLSWRSSTSNPGPLLTIFGDADAVILGPSESVPDVPALPDKVQEKASESSLSALAGRISKQTMSRISTSITSSSPTPSSTENGKNAPIPVKIVPIRTMQPPRQVTTEVASPLVSSPVSHTSIEPDQANGMPPVSLTAKRTASGSSQKTVTTTPKPVIAAAPTHSEPASSRAIVAKESQNTTPPVNIPPKVKQVLGIKPETPPATRMRLPVNWTSPNFSSAKPKTADAGRSKKTPSLDSADRLTKRELGPDSITSHLDLLTPSRTAQYHNSVDLPGPSDLGSSKSATPIRRYLSPRLLAPMSERRKPQGSTPVPSPSPLGNDSAKEHGVKNSNNATSKRLKVKRSFREIFHRGATKHPEKPLAVVEPERAFMSGTRSSLAKRIRDSANLSKIHLPRMSEVKSELLEMSEPATTIDHISATGAPTKDAHRQAALSSLQAMSSSPTEESAAVPQYDTATVITNIIDRVTSMPSDSPDRLRGLEIAEAVLHTVDCYREAKVSAEKARKHARDAELNVERAGLELLRLQKLCEPNFNSETLQAIKDLVKSTGLVAGEDVAFKAVTPEE